MSDQIKKSTVGPPIWVETILTPEEYRQCAILYPSCFSNGSTAPVFNPNIHKGGTWRKNMGGGLTPTEIVNFNYGMDNLRKLMQTKKFQHRPEYGTHAEAKP